MNQDQEGIVGGRIKDMNNPLLIPEIAEKLMDVLNKKTIMDYRLVCRLWNEEAVTKLRKRILTNQVKFPEIFVMYKSNDEIITRFIPPFFEESEILDILLSNMCIVYSAASSLQYAFLDLGNSLIGHVWSNRAAIDHLKQHFEMNKDGRGESVLWKYRQQVKSVNFYLHLDNIDLMVPLLTTMCPNVEKLRVSGSLNDLSTLLSFPENCTLNVESLKFNCGRTDSEKEYMEIVLFLKQIMGACAKLKSLKVFCYKQFDPVADTIISHKNISRNLIKIELSSDIFDKLHLLNKIQFGPLKHVKLKYRPLYGKFTYTCSPLEILTEFKRFLTSYRHTMKILDLQIHYDKSCFEDPLHYALDGAENGERFNLNLNVDEETDVFPEMPNLEALTTFFSFKSLGFLENLPNLEKLQLTGIQNIDQFLTQPCPENKIGDACLHNDIVIEYIDKFQIIDQVGALQNQLNLFPNLTKLYVNLYPLSGFKYPQPTDWFASACQEISKAKSLKHLKLWFDTTSALDPSMQWWSIQADLELGFDLLKNIPNLESIVLGIELDLFWKTVIFPTSALIKLLDAPKLRLLKLVNLKIGEKENLDLNEMMEGMEVFFEKFRKNDIKVTRVAEDRVGPLGPHPETWENDIE